MCFKLGHEKLQPSSARGTFSKSGCTDGGRKNVRFSTENWPYLENGKKYGEGH